MCDILNEVQVNFIELPIIVRAAQYPDQQPIDHYKALKMGKSKYHRLVEFLAAKKATRASIESSRKVDRPAYISITNDSNDVRRRIINVTEEGKALLTALNNVFDDTPRESSKVLEQHVNALKTKLYECVREIDELQR